MIAGLATGAIYALVAIGFTLLWQTSQTINFAQGEFVMLPAFLMLAVMRAGAPFWLAVIVGARALGRDPRRRVQEAARRSDVASRRAAARHRDDGAVGRHEGIGQALLQRRGAALPLDRADGSVSIFGSSVSLQSLGVFAFGVVAVVGLSLFLERTSTGRQMQAAAQNPTVARILGIPVERMILLTFVINAALVALASLLVTPIYLAKFGSGETLGQAAFIAAIVGGFNQVRGAIVGGLLIGVVDNLAAAYISTQYRDAVPLVCWSSSSCSGRKGWSAAPKSGRYDARRNA